MTTLPGRWADPAFIGAPAEGPCDLVPHRGRSRRAWIRANGEIPHGLLVLHHCDEPRCIAIRHLFLGTQTDNIADAIAKGRHVPPPILTVHSASHNKAIADSKRGKPTSEAHRAAVRRSWETRSRVVSEEIRQKQSEGLRRGYAEGRIKSRLGVPRSERRAS